MSSLHHFNQIRDLKAFEQRLIRLLVDSPNALAPNLENALRYALALAQLNDITDAHGDTLHLHSDVQPFRDWLVRRILPLFPPDAPPDLRLLHERLDPLILRIQVRRRKLLERYGFTLPIELLDNELSQKRLLLVLGGGGGAGYAHLAVLALLHELAVTPALIVGTSFGSLIGLLRATSDLYNQQLVFSLLPHVLQLERMFRPFRGRSRYGFPGVATMQIYDFVDQLFRQVYNTPMPSLEELPIPLVTLATGIRTGYSIDESIFHTDQSFWQEGSRRLHVSQFMRTIRDLARNARYLREVPLGADESTRKLPVIDAVGFSCAIPGLIHYDVFDPDRASVPILDELFAREQLLSLCDGGIVNNVPSRVAWEIAQRGDLGTRNVYIFASDVFAPRGRGRNLPWLMLQQGSRLNVAANLPYADLQKTFLRPPSPLEVSVSSRNRLLEIVATARAELQDEFVILRKALSPIDTRLFLA